MPDSISSIDNLAKVSLTIQENTPETNDAKKSSFTFIYGASPFGITPFEKALYGKQVGDQIDFELETTNSCETIGHLEKPLREQTGIHAPTCLHVIVADISRAEDREVISAMAGGGSCGGGDCDCGCGGH